MAEGEVQGAMRDTRAELPANVVEVVALSERVGPPEVVRLELLDVEACREESARERRPHEHAEPVLQRDREQPLFLAALQRAVLELQRGNRADGERALDEVGRVVRD